MGSVRYSRMRDKTEKRVAAREGNAAQQTFTSNNKRGRAIEKEREKGRLSFASESGLGADRDWVLQKDGSEGWGPRIGQETSQPRIRKTE